MITGKFIVCLFASYLVGLVNSILPRGILRHTWLAVTGMLACSFVFGAPWILLLMSALVVWCVLVLASLLKGTAAVVLSSVAAVLAFDIMFSRHIVRAGASSSGLDDCAAQMVLFLKLAHLCFAVADGAGTIGKLRKDAKIADGDKDIRRKLAGKAARSRLTRALSFVPNPIAVLGYCFNPTTAMAGPAFSYSVYTLAQDGCIVSDGKAAPMTKEQLARAGKATPLWRALSGFFFGVILMAMFSVGSGIFPVDSLFDLSIAQEAVGRLVHGETGTFIANIVSGKDETTHPVIRVLVSWVWISLVQVVVRFQYYGSWIIAEGATATAGMGLDPAWVSKEGPAPESMAISDHLEAYAQANNIEPLAVESATTYKAAINKWNKHTQMWLAESVFKRFPTAFGMNNHAVFVVSALWHGVFPGYFLSLPVMAVAVPAMTAAYTTLRGPLDALVGTEKAWGYLGPLGWFLRWVSVVGLLNYFMAPFMLLKWHLGLELLQRTYFFGHIFVVLCIVIAVVGGILGLGRKSKPKSKKD